MSATVAVIGAGNIGSRHLQALARLPADVGLYVADPSSEALGLSRHRYEEVAAPGESANVTYVRRLDDLPDVVDIAIVATTADVRAAATTALLDQRDVRFLVLEKVMFQRLVDYEVVGALLRAGGVPAWVNLPRRQFSGYRPVADALRVAAWVDYRVSGSSWGLGCNGVHFLDHVAHLVGASGIHVDASGLDPGTTPARRAGFREFTGSVTGSCGPATFSLTSRLSGDVPVQISIDSDVARFVVREQTTALHVWAATPSSTWLFERFTTVLPQQSQLTHLVVTQLLNDGRCDLTPFDEASTIHLAFIGALLGHLRADGRADVDACPVT